MQERGLVQDLPQPAELAELCGLDAVEQVMTRDHGDPDGADGPARQVNKPRENDHRNADRPDHLQEDQVWKYAERPGEAHDREFQQHQPQSAGEQKPAHLAHRPAARAIEEGGCAREEHENRGAEMRDPAREEQSGVVDVARVEAGGREKVAGVVERHQHHDEAAQQVDRVEPDPARQLHAGNRSRSRQRQGARGDRRRGAVLEHRGHWFVVPLSWTRSTCIACCVTPQGRAYRAGWETAALVRRRAAQLVCLRFKMTSAAPRVCFDCCGLAGFTLGPAACQVPDQLPARFAGKTYL